MGLAGQVLCLAVLGTDALTIIHTTLSVYQFRSLQVNSCRMVSQVKSRHILNLNNLEAIWTESINQGSVLEKDILASHNALRDTTATS